MSFPIKLSLALLTSSLIVGGIQAQNESPKKDNTKEVPRLKAAALRVEHTNATRVVFSPDGRWLITCGVEGGSTAVIMLWNAATSKLQGEPIRIANVLNVHSNPAPFVSPDSNRLVYQYHSGPSLAEQRAQIWELPSLKPVGEPLRFRGNPGSKSPSTNVGGVLALTPQGRAVTITTEGGFGKTKKSTFQFWDLTTGKTSGESKMVNAHVSHMVFTKDEKKALINVRGLGPNYVQLFDVEKGTILGNQWATGNALNLALDPDEKAVLIHSIEETNKTPYVRTSVVRRWEIATGQPASEAIRIRVLEQGRLPNNEPNRAALHRDGRIAAVLTDDATVQIHDVANGKSLGTPLKHTDPVYQMHFTSDAKCFVTASGTANRPDGCWVWDVASGKGIGQLPVEGKIIALMPHPRDALVATLNDKGVLETWDLTMRK